MTALARSATRKSMTPAAVSPILVQLFAMPLAASTTIYQGAMVALDQSGNLTNASADNSLRVVGVLDAPTVDNSAGIAGALTAVPTRGAFYFVNSATTDAITDADLGRACYVVDNNTVARTSALGVRPVAGRVIGVDDNGVLVELGALLDPQSDADILVLANADLSAKQFHFVDLANNSGVAAAVACTAAGQRIVGIVQNAPASGAVAVIRPVGCGRTSKCIAGGAITAGDTLGTKNDGRAKTGVASSVSGAATVGSNGGGVALSTTSSNGDVFTVLLTSFGLPPTTAA